MQSLNLTQNQADDEEHARESHQGAIVESQGQPPAGDTIRTRAAELAYDDIECRNDKRIRKWWSTVQKPSS